MATVSSPGRRCEHLGEPCDDAHPGDDDGAGPDCLVRLCALGDDRVLACRSTAGAVGSLAPSSSQAADVRGRDLLDMKLLTFLAAASLPLSLGAQAYPSGLVPGD